MSIVPSELDFLRSGTYNLGFIGLSRDGGPSGQWQDLLKWWQQRLYTHSVSRVETGRFVDQKWADLMPALFDQVFICRDPEFNVAYWNLKNRVLERKEGTYLFDGRPLVFFHFSGHDYNEPDRLSRHQNRFELRQLSQHHQDLYSLFRHRLREHGIEETICFPYTFKSFPDGVPITPVVRACLYDIDPEGTRWPDPYDVDAADSFRAWLLEPGVEAQFVSPYMIALYHLLHLEKVFPDPTGLHSKVFAEWFVAQEGLSELFHSTYIRPIRNALQASILVSLPPQQSRMRHFAGQTFSRLGLPHFARRLLQFFRIIS